MASTGVPSELPQSRDALVGRLKQPEVVPEVIAEPPPIAMTLKLPYSDYLRLKTLAAKRKTRSQAIMLEAVRAYLDRLDKT